MSNSPRQKWILLALVLAIAVQLWLAYGWDYVRSHGYRQPEPPKAAPVRVKLTQDYEALLQRLDRKWFVSSLQAGDYQELDRQMGLFQRAYEQGEIPDTLLDALYRDTVATDLSLEPRLNEWVQRYPESYQARFVRAGLYRNTGIEARGGKWSSETAPENFERMYEWFGKAESDYAESRTLTVKPLLTSTALMLLHMYESDRKAIDAEFARALKIEPLSYVAHRRYMYTLQRRWGGSDEEMEAFHMRLLQSGMDRVSADSIFAMYFGDLARDEIDEDKYEEAYVHAKAALDLAKPRANQQEAGEMRTWLVNASFAKYMLGDNDTSLQLADAVLALDAGDVEGHVRRASALKEMNRMPEAVPDLRYCAERGRDWCQFRYGELLLDGLAGVTRNEREGKRLVWQALEQGYKPPPEDLQKLILR